MKNKILLIGLLLFSVVIGISLAVIFNKYNENNTSIYSCIVKSDAEIDHEYYSVNSSGDASFSNFEQECEKIKRVKCKNCTIVGNDTGYKYGDLLLLLLYDEEDKVQIYDANDFEMYDSINGVNYNEKWFQRDDSHVALYNDSELFAFIFPDKDNNDLLYRLSDKKIVSLALEQDFYYNTYFTHYSSHLEADNDLYDKNVSVSKYITRISDGLIQVRGVGYQFGIYDLINNKFLIPFEDGHFIQTSDGFIRYNMNTRVVKYYNTDGQLIISSDNKDSFKYNSISIMDVLNDDLVLIISDDYKGLIFVNSKGEIVSQVSLTFDKLREDILSTIDNQEVKGKLEFIRLISNYFDLSYYDETNGKVKVLFEYKNDYYGVNATINYSVDINNKTIERIN